MRNIYRNGRVHVCERMCPTCIFRPHNLMHLREGRVAEMVTGCGEIGAITCHSTLDTDANSVCRGFYDRHRNAMLQVATRLGVVTFTS